MKKLASLLTIDGLVPTNGQIVWYSILLWVSLSMSRRIIFSSSAIRV